MSDLQCAATLVVARHADAAYVEDFFSDEGGWLTHEGRDQARILAKALASRRIAHVWCSDSARCVQTAEIVAAALGVGVTSRKSLREIQVGVLNGAPFHVERLQPVTGRWYDGDLSARFDGGESGAEVVARYRGTFSEIADLHRGETVLVVAHQTAASIALLALGGNLSPTYAREHQLGNAEAAELVVDGDDWRLESFGPLDL